MSVEHVGVAVVGGGQAGLAVSRELRGAAVDHVVLERGRIGQTWRDRWDSFCLVTPNWTCSCPASPNDGDDAVGFTPRDEIVAYSERYAAANEARVREGVAVISIRTVENERRFVLQTRAGELRADHARTRLAGRAREPGARSLVGDRKGEADLPLPSRA